MKVPDVYSGSPASFKDWRMDLRGYVASQDDNIPWLMILNDIEKRGKLVISEDLTRKCLQDRGYDEDESYVIVTNLYSHLSKCTSGSAAGKVKQGGYKAVFETYRQLYQEGMKISKASIFAMKSQVYTVQTAKCLRDIPSLIAK